LNGPPFALTGSSTFSSTQFSFELTFDNDADQGTVLCFEWYLDQVLVIHSNVRTFAAQTTCGAHIIGCRILTSGGWSGIKQMAFQTCVSIGVTGPDSIQEGSTATYQVIETFADGSTVDITTQFTFSCPEGPFTGATLSVPANHTTNDTRQATVTATDADGNIQTKTITVIDDSVPLTLLIDGPDMVDEGSVTSYTVIATYSGGITVDLTAQYTFSCTEGTFTGATLHMGTNTTIGDTRQATITAAKSGESPLTKQITIRDITVVAGIAIVGPDSVDEGSQATYRVIETFGDGSTSDETAAYTFTTTEGTFANATLSIPANDTVGDTRLATITATRISDGTLLRKDVSIVDTTNVLGILVVDLFNYYPLDVIAFIDNAEVAETHVAAHTGTNIVPLTAPGNAMILASDFVNDTVLNWRFEFNIAKLVSLYPSTSQFTFYIKGRGNVIGQITGAYVTKTYASQMIMVGSPGSYLPSVNGTDVIAPQSFSSNVVDGANGDLSEASLTNIAQFVYHTSSHDVSITTY
jgi:hypothetical protein